MTAEHTAEPHPTDQQKVTQLIKGIRVAMVTTSDASGALLSRPMATQEVEFDGNVWFIAERDSALVRQLSTGSAAVNVAYVGSSSWVSLSGTARVVDDIDKLREQWNLFTDAWMEGGPENPNNVLVLVESDSAQYWDAPGSKVTQLLNLAKAKVTGQRYEGDSNKVDMQ